MIIIKKILVFLCFLFAFDTLEVDSNSDKITYYDSTNPYIEDVYTLYFDNLNSSDLELLINEYDLKVLSYQINGNKYYAKNIRDLNEQLLKNKSFNEKIYFENYGYSIDAIKIVCNIGDIINLKKKIHIY